MGGLGSALHHRRGTAGRRRGGAPRRRRGRPVASSGWVRSTWRSAGPNGSGWWGRTGRARPRSSRRCSDGCPWPPGRRGWDRAWWSASSARTAARRRRAPPTRGRCSTGVIDRCGLTVPEARSLLAKFGLGPEHLEPVEGTAVAGGAHPGGAGHVPGPAESTSSFWTSPPTTSTSPPSSRSRRRCRGSAGPSCSCPTTGACSMPSTSPDASISPSTSPAGHRDGGVRRHRRHGHRRSSVPGRSERPHHGPHLFVDGAARELDGGGQEVESVTGTGEAVQLHRDTGLHETLRVDDPLVA